MMRPLLLLVDRGVDLGVMMHHPWTYQALAHDILPCAHNKLFIKGNFQEIDRRRDTFWNEFA
jgi:hypothetical protein